MNVNEFKKQLESLLMNFIEDESDELLQEFSKESIYELQEAFSSAEAIQFTVKMNKFYEDQGILDDYGEPLTIQHPENLQNKIAWNADGSGGTIEFTEAEERWLRANQLYGNNILGKLGFNYLGGV